VRTDAAEVDARSCFRLSKWEINRLVSIPLRQGNAATGPLSVASSNCLIWSATTAKTRELLAGCGGVASPSL
jgi:hypothetical protein